MNLDISKIALKIAKEFLSANYVYDPEHKHKPTGGNWQKTNRGWSDFHETDVEVKKQNSVQALTDLGFKKSEIEAILSNASPFVFNTVPKLAKNGNLKRIIQKSGGNLHKVVAAIDGVATYVQDRESKINHSLRKGVVTPESEKMMEMIRLGPKNKKDVVFRGMTIKKDEVVKFQPNSVFSDKGFVSTSEDKNLASGFALWNNKSTESVPVMLNISGVKNMGLSIYSLRGVKQISENNEVVLPPQTEFEVTQVKEHPFTELRKMYPYSDKNFKPDGYVEGTFYLEVQVRVKSQKIASLEESSVPLFNIENQDDQNLQFKRIYEPLLINFNNEK